MIPLIPDQSNAPLLAAKAILRRGVSRVVVVELIYQLRPDEARARLVFDHALRSRWNALAAGDGVLLVCRDQAALESLAPLIAPYPDLPIVAVAANPRPAAPDRERDSLPAQLDWGGRWRRMDRTDRWARLDMALRIGEGLHGLGHRGWLAMPANDAVWGRGLLDWLLRVAARRGRGRLTAISPHTLHQHSPVAGAEIPPEVIGLLNVAFARDASYPQKLARGELQAFWGKMGLLPVALCADVLRSAEQYVWEDDVEINRAIGDTGLSIGVWVRDPRRYRQALPVFDTAGVRRVITRTLHYSLNIPSVDASYLTQTLGWREHVRRHVNPLFARYEDESLALIADCHAEIMRRLARFGASWVDWGAYRYVMRPGDPAVSVWQRIADASGSTRDERPIDLL